jgi:hypothetical protein|tara:strand:- start:298 stop:504 length:207 start_codon:yes stop_codon:yes gene_type:complete
MHSRLLYRGINMAKKVKEAKEVVEEPKEEEAKEEVKEVVSESGKYRKVFRNGEWILKDKDGNVIVGEE